MPSRNGETKRETRVAKVSQEAVGRQLSRLPVAGRNMQWMLPKSAASVTASPDGGNCRRKARRKVTFYVLFDGRRLCQNARPSDCKFLAFNSWRMRLLPCLKTGVSAT